MDPNRIFRIMVGIFLLSFAVGGCSPANTPLDTPVQPTPTPTRQVPTSTLSPSPTPTLTFTPTATNTMLPPTQTPTWTSEPPTPTPGATLSSANLEALVLQMQNDPGCGLPCWWGFTPGETEWATARDFFLARGIISEAYVGPIYRLDVATRRLNLHVNITTENGVIYTIFVGLSTKLISPRLELLTNNHYLQEATHRFSITQTLAALGKPEQVKFFARKSGSGRIYREDVPIFELLLYYPQKGILISYTNYTIETDSSYRFCTTNAEIRLILWAPASGLTLESAIIKSTGIPERIELEHLSTYRLIEEVSGYSLEEFYEAFQEEGACFETEKTIWDW